MMPRYSMLPVLALLAPGFLSTPVGAVAEGVIIRLSAVPVTAAEFKTFGQVVEASRAVRPTAENAVLSYWSGLARTQIHGDIEFGLMTVKSRDHVVAEMERHVKTPELLVSLRDDYLLVAAPPTPPRARRAFPDAAKTRVFLVARDQAVILHKGTWHALPFPAGREGLFLVAFRAGTAKSDLKERPFRSGEIIRF